MTALRLGSLFGGIGVFPLAAVRCGIEPVWASEIEKAPISITKRHFPDMEHLGDVTKLDGREIPPVHMGAAVRAAEKAVGCGEPMTCRGAALRRSPAFTTSGHFVPKR